MTLIELEVPELEQRHQGEVPAAARVVEDPAGNMPLGVSLHLHGPADRPGTPSLSYLSGGRRGTRPGPLLVRYPPACQRHLRMGLDRRDRALHIEAGVVHGRGRPSLPTPGETPHLR